MSQHCSAPCGRMRSLTTPLFPVHPTPPTPGELVLWGATLWDPRVPQALHTFDQLSEAGAGGAFHPNGLELIMNSEVGAGCSEQT